MPSAVAQVELPAGEPAASREPLRAFWPSHAALQLFPSGSQAGPLLRCSDVLSLAPQRANATPSCPLSRPLSRCRHAMRPPSARPAYLRATGSNLLVRTSAKTAQRPFRRRSNGFPRTCAHRSCMAGQHAAPSTREVAQSCSHRLVGAQTTRCSGPKFSDTSSRPLARKMRARPGTSRHANRRVPRRAAALRVVHRVKQQHVTRSPHLGPPQPKAHLDHRGSRCGKIVWDEERQGWPARGCRSAGLGRQRNAEKDVGGKGRSWRAG
ncbi:hypothetical protein TRVL_04147 [Trypanosoma vivax]|nr:hypothetical protein TRVL_04147 [Trypanosoma vivax]